MSENNRNGLKFFYKLNSARDQHSNFLNLQTEENYGSHDLFEWIFHAGIDLISLVILLCCFPFFVSGGNRKKSYWQTLFLGLLFLGLLFLGLIILYHSIKSS